MKYDANAGRKRNEFSLKTQNALTLGVWVGIMKTNQEDPYYRIHGSEEGDLLNTEIMTEPIAHLARIRDLT